jgi:hypothetical protein
MPPKPLASWTAPSIIIIHLVAATTLSTDFYRRANVGTIPLAWLRDVDWYEDGVLLKRRKESRKAATKEPSWEMSAELYTSVAFVLLLHLCFKFTNKFPENHWNYQYFGCAFPRFTQHIMYFLLF